MLNKVQLIGNLGSDPDVRYMPNGGAVVTVSLATTRTWRDKQTGDKKEETEWHRVIFFGRLGEIAGEYLKKGAKIYAEGRLKTRKWQGQDGQDRYTTEIIGEEMHMLGGNREGQSYAPSSSNQGSKPSKQSAPAYEPPAQSSYDDFSDDIPFMDMPKLLAKHHLI